MKIEGYYNGVTFALDGSDEQVLAIAKYIKFLTREKATEESRVGG